MGKEEDREDARAGGNYTLAFSIGKEILDRKDSKRLIGREIDNCVQDLTAAGKADLLPSNFGSYSVYGQRDLLLKIKLQE